MKVRSLTRLLVGAAMATTFALPVFAADLRIGASTETSSIDPHFANTESNFQVIRNVFEHLVTFDPKMKLTPALAISWKAIDDKTWEIKLRPNVKFHDGSPFTADDVIFSFERVPLVVNSPSPLTGFTQGKTFTKVDDLTVRATTPAPYPLLPNDLTRISIVSKKSAAGASTQDFNSGKAAVGTGPYRFVEWISGDRVVFEANANWWGGKPKWDRVIYRPIKSAPSRVAGILAGDVDVIDNVPTSDVSALRKNADIQVFDVASLRMIYMMLDYGRDVSPFVKGNDGNPIFPNPLRVWEVRKALSMAINRDAMVERVMEGNAVAAAQLVPEGAFGYSPRLKVEAYDPEGAKKLLAKVGLGDGFNLTIHGPNDRYVNDAKILEALAQMFTRIGIKTEVVAQPMSTFQARASRLEYSVPMTGSASGTGESSSSLKNNLHSFNKEGGYGAVNRGRYYNVRVDQLTEEALSTLDDAKREKLLQEAMEIAMNDVAVLPLHFQLASWATRKGFTYEARSDENTLAQSVSRTN